jgi:hypothetical protein
MQTASKFLSLKNITFIGEGTGDQFNSINDFLISGQKTSAINATLTMTATGGVFAPETFRFRTNSNTQTLTITMDSPEKLEDDNGYPHPRFHFLQVIPTAEGFIQSIKHETPNGNSVVLLPSEISPSHTNQITLNLRMHGIKPRTSFYINVAVWDRKEKAVAEADPQVGNDPP